MAEAYCLQNVPLNHGSLWVTVKDSVLTVTNPASTYWRGKIMSIAEFNALVIELRKKNG
jgi:hypothetical protein